MHTISQSIIEALGATLMHSLWQGLVIVLILSFLLKVLKHKSPQFKYHLSCASLFGLVTWMSSTFFNNFNYKINHYSDTILSNNINIPIFNGEINEALHWQDNLEVYFSSFIELYASELVFIWMLGVILFGLKWSGSFYYTFSLKKNNTSIVPLEWQQKVKQLSYKLGIHKKINILESAKVDVPMVIGYLKPVILIPTSAFTGFTATQLEAVIVHELAHIKNNDFLINMILSALEVVLFYHPAYWYIYKIIMQERENHCDDIAVAHIGNPRLYAETLFNMEKIRQQHSLAMALQGNKNQLLERIKRICVSPNQVYKGGINKSGMALGFLFILAIISLAKVPLDAKETILIPLSEEITESINETLENKFNNDIYVVKNEVSSNKIEDLPTEVEHVELIPKNIPSFLSSIPVISEFNLALKKEDILLQPLESNILQVPSVDSIPNKEGITLTIVSELDKDGNTSLTYYKKGKVTKRIYIEQDKANYRLNGKKLPKGNKTYELTENDNFSIKGKMQIFEVDDKSTTTISQLDETELNLADTDGIVTTIVSELDKDGKTTLTYYKNEKVTKRIYIEKNKANFRLNGKKLPKGNKTYKLKKGDNFSIKGTMQIFEVDKDQSPSLLNVDPIEYNMIDDDETILLADQVIIREDDSSETIFKRGKDTDIKITKNEDDQIIFQVFGKDGKLLTEEVRGNSPEALLEFETEIENAHLEVENAHLEVEKAHLEVDKAHLEIEKERAKVEELHRELEIEHEQNMKEHEIRMKQHDAQLKKHVEELKKHEKEMQKHAKEMVKQQAQDDKMELFREILLTELVNDKLIKSPKKFSFSLTAGKLKINGKRVHDKYHNKYLKLYEKHSGSRMNSNSKYKWEVS